MRMVFVLITCLSLTQAYASNDAECDYIKMLNESASYYEQWPWIASLLEKDNNTCRKWNLLRTSMYYQMPKLFAYDDYDECIGTHAYDAVYCVTNVDIVANTSSDLYNYIVEYSNNRKQHYRHDKLTRGICLNECRKLIDSESKNDDEVISDCVNSELTDKYGLQGTSKVNFCVTPNDQIPLDNYDVIVALLVAFLVIIVVTSSLYDRYLRNKINNDLKANIHYQSGLKTSKTDQWLTLFSLRRNWLALNQPSKGDFSDLKMFQFMRVFTFFCVILGHCYTFSVGFPSSNPIYIENFHKKITSMFLLNGNMVIFTFFYMSGFLSAYMFMFHREKDRCSDWIFFAKAVIFRYIRLVPVLLFMITLHATWLIRFGDGPFWNQFVNNERRFCRDNWWINLIFLNNYIQVDKICIIQTWYISADFWLSMAANVSLIIIVKYPSLKNLIVSSIIGFSMVITGYINYVNKFEPVPIVSPEAERLFRSNMVSTDPDDKDYFGIFYAPAHMNLGNYFIGIATGLWYKNIKNSNVNFRKNLLLKIVSYLCVIVGVLIILSAYIFYVFDFEKPSIWLTLLAVAIKHSWGVILAIGTVGIMNRHGWFTRNLLSYDGFKIFGRISYTAFICHVFILKVMMMGTHRMIEMSMITVFTITIACFVLSNFFGLLLTLSIELPVASALKILSLKRENSVEELHKKSAENDNML